MGNICHEEASNDDYYQRARMALSAKRLNLQTTQKQDSCLSHDSLSSDISDNEGFSETIEKTIEKTKKRAIQ